MYVFFISDPPETPSVQEISKPSETPSVLQLSKPPETPSIAEGNVLESGMMPTPSASAATARTSRHYRNGKYYKFSFYTYLVIIFQTIVVKRHGEFIASPAPGRMRICQDRQKILDELQAAVTVARETLVSQRTAHEDFIRASDAAAEAQSRMRIAARLAAEAEEKSVAAANQVRRLHLALGTLNIGMLRQYLCVH